jgi:hypothetical protein
MAVLDVASRYRETFLYNAYLMGKRAIERGSTDTWTVTPRGSSASASAPAIGTARRRRRRWAAASARCRRRMPACCASRPIATRAATSCPPRSGTSPPPIKFANTLMKTGVTVHRATAAFTVNGKAYPAGSIVVKTAQAFRAHVLDMFEPQDHPERLRVPRGPPIPPYDSAGWTLAFQMGLGFDRILDGFDGPFETVTGFIDRNGPSPDGDAIASPAGYLLSAAEN